MEEKQKDEATELNAAFLKEYGDLVAKHNRDFVTFPMFQPDGQGAWKILLQTQVVIVDAKNMPIKSPFVAEK